ncbi:unnamed protein product [Cylindrotheca closterium]|uniref:DDE Tnp4 domain-containing protein n=1 Tax=Cylindrotheca closterium TaxID=2856 RepID=A0AAD2PY31_9STRA|nr:unnamed protein product [Cylindrotheca closterium]
MLLIADKLEYEEEQEETAEEFEENRLRRRYEHTAGRPQTPRKRFNHGQAKQNILHDWLGPSPLYSDEEFKGKFRISRARFQKILEDVKGLNKSFYSEARNITNQPVASIEARLLLALECLDYGVSAKSMATHYKMSANLAIQACKEFDNVIGELYEEEFLRVPTAEDLRNISKLHESKFGVKGLFAFLDCCHSQWHKCPKAHQGSYKGKEGKTTIVLEAASDYNRWFWHTAYGFTGAMNDINILRRSPLIERLIDGSFVQVEKQSGVVPFQIGENEFDKCFFLTDGIYPKYSRFVKGLSAPISHADKSFNSWQEGARKAIEGAFGNLEQKFKFFSSPINLWNVDTIAKRVRTCLILHNMTVSDRVMNGDVNARYDPSASVQHTAVHVNGDTGARHNDAAHLVIGANVEVTLADDMVQLWKSL